MNLWTGTSGYQYDEWKGKFYPEKLSKTKMLGFYSDEFTATESNYTFKAIPSKETIHRWDDETPAAFRFALKATQQITHKMRLRGCAAVLNEFADAVSGLGEKRGPVLFQLPPDFRRDVALLRDFLQSMPGGLRAAFEFRHESWFADDTWSILRGANAALCIAEGDLQSPREVTADFGYLRLRRTDYTAADLKERARFVREQNSGWSDAFVFFKHEETCCGPRFAKQFMDCMS